MSVAVQSLRRSVKVLISGLCRVLVPPLCPLCRQPLSQSQLIVCDICARGLSELDPPFCSICALPFPGVGPNHACPRCLDESPGFAELRSWGIYRGALLELIHSFKYRRDLGTRWALEELALRGFDRHWGPGRFAFVVPVPCHPRTLRNRGFNLPSLLSRRLAGARGIQWRPAALGKRKQTADLVGLSPKERSNEVKGVFEALETLEGEVLLVDDVATSTATARACARACLDAGAAEVRVLVLARTPLGGK